MSMALERAFLHVLLAVLAAAASPAIMGMGDWGWPSFSRQMQMRMALESGCRGPQLVSCLMHSCEHVVHSFKCIFAKINTILEN